jgi:diguanylate cyclase (GGDEF)-like protein
MSLELERRRVLIAAAPEERAALAAPFARGQVEGWEAGEAESFEQARFLLQHDACDVLLVDHSLYRPEDVDGLEWLARQQQPPVAYLAGADPAALAAVLERGAGPWLPRELALAHPALLATVLNQAAARGERRRNHRRLGEALQECRRQVRQLVTLLWTLSPTEGHPRWFTQRHMMERLQEEIARTQRHGTPLSVVLGEVRAGGDARSPADAPQVAAWTAERIAHCKRRTDVAGQYGPNGFILLLAHTPAAGAAVCCRRLRGVLEEGSVPSAVPPGPVTAFFGISSYDAAHANAKSLLGRAEERLERARGDGSGRVVF